MLLLFSSNVCLRHSNCQFILHRDVCPHNSIGQFVYRRVSPPQSIFSFRAMSVQIIPPASCSSSIAMSVCLIPPARVSRGAISTSFHRPVCPSGDVCPDHSTGQLFLLHSNVCLPHSTSQCPVERYLPHSTGQFGLRSDVCLPHSTGQFSLTLHRLNLKANWSSVSWFCPPVCSRRLAPILCLPHTQREQISSIPPGSKPAVT